MLQRVCLPQDLEAVRFRLLSDSKTFSAPNGEQHFDSTAASSIFWVQKVRSGCPQARRRACESVKLASYGRRGMVPGDRCRSCFHSGPIYLVFLDDLSPAASTILAPSGRAAGVLHPLHLDFPGIPGGLLLLRDPNVRWFKICDRNYSNGNGFSRSRSWIPKYCGSCPESLLGASAAPIVRAGVEEMFIRMRTAHESM